MSVVYDRNGLEILSADECQSLLKQGYLGRIGIVTYSQGHPIPLVLPVNYCVDGGDIVFRFAQGTKLQSIATGRDAAFEIDDIENTYQTGWSVVVLGPAQVMNTQEELDHAKTLPLKPWATGRTPDWVWVRLTPKEITGRRIPLGEKNSM